MEKQVTVKTYSRKSTAMLLRSNAQKKTGKEHEVFQAANGEWGFRELIKATAKASSSATTTVTLEFVNESKGSIAVLVNGVKRWFDTPSLVDYSVIRGQVTLVMEQSKFARRKELHTV